MPGWHNATKDLVAQGKLTILGVTQEQHAERCRLFAQWHGFGWPILHDPINLLGSDAVPIVVAIDEHGIVRSTRPTQKWLKEEFLTAKYRAGDAVAPTDSEAESNQRAGDEYALWSPNSPSKAVDAYAKAIEVNASAENHFRLGVALRSRYDSLDRRPDDFMRAVSHWTTALGMNPNQYIWRRRIQQYGPRLAKPYPFYDWVPKAQTEIAARGETPIQLTVPISGAEIAKPAKSKVGDASKAPDAASPDPQGRITRDDGLFVAITSAAAPARIKPRQSLQLHLELTPVQRSVHWNNEAEPLRVWIETPNGWTSSTKLISYDGDPGAAESSERRLLDVEIQSTEDATDGTLNGFALYYVCEELGGQCLLRRQDFTVALRVSR